MMARFLKIKYLVIAAFAVVLLLFLLMAVLYPTNVYAVGKQSVHYEERV